LYLVGDARIFDSKPKSIDLVSNLVTEAGRAFNPGVNHKLGAFHPGVNHKLTKLIGGLI